MKLTRTEFDILTYFESTHLKNPSAQTMAVDMDIDVKLIEPDVKNLTQNGYIDNGRITEKGLEALEPYRVKRAVFIAAGFGSRLVPVTLNTPKPLVRVKGVRMIDTLLDAVYAAGIEEVIIVRGYLGEQFDQLLYKYKNIKFIENPMYNEANNISSAMLAADYLGGAYVFEADLVLYNPKLITKYQYCSNYLGVPTDVTDDWCFEVDGDKITKIKIGGENCCHMYGISYWTEEDGKKLGKHVKEVFNMPGGKEKYWDEVSLDIYKSEYDVEVRRCTFNDIVEIDTFADLKKIDSIYNV